MEPFRPLSHNLHTIRRFNGSDFGEPLISTGVLGAQHLGAVRHLPWLLFVLQVPGRVRWRLLARLQGN